MYRYFGININIKYEVYIYFDPRYSYKTIIDDVCYIFKPVYVGKGKISDKRKDKHLSKNKYRNTKLVYLNEYLKHNHIEPVCISVFQTDCEISAFQKECDLISSIGRENKKTGPLFNLTYGGEGVTGRIISQQQRILTSQHMRKYWSGMDSLQRREHGKKSLAGRSSENVAAGAAKQRITKSNFSDEHKQDIERKRYPKWQKTYYKRGKKERQITSKKCSKASYKKSMYFIKYKENDIYKENWLLDMVKSGYARDGIMYRITGKVDLHKPFKSRTTGNHIQLVSFEMRNDYPI